MAVRDGIDNLTGVLKDKRNRGLLAVFGFIIVFAISFAVWGILSQANKGENSFGVSVNSATPDLVALGKPLEEPTPQYEKAKETYNTTTIKAVREEDNPAVQPIPSLKSEQIESGVVVPAVEEVAEKAPEEEIAYDCDPCDTQCVIARSAQKRCQITSKSCQVEQRIIPPNYFNAQCQTSTTEESGGSQKVQQDVLALIADLNKVGGGGGTMNVSFEYPEDAQDAQVGEDTLASSDTLPSADTLDGDAEQREAVIRAGEVVYGINSLAINSDYLGPVSLEIVGGRFRGSRLLGSAVRKEDKMRLELNLWVSPSGDWDDRPINAIALDIDTTLAAINSNVDYHTLYRYGWWGAGTVLSAIGTAAATVTQQSSSDEGVVTSSSSATASDETKIAVGQLGQAIGEQFADRINRPPTVTVDRGADMGVFFMETVYKESAL